ncbi:AmmeMemoRadiSam system protein A [Maridesulfovibrio hydrothermalis]|uniref:Protein TON_1965 n=1 Tax=Maridesulfovibrio hydrothermalis AM13 = DSM 14728 TaxID=1121451 RepID=L0R7Q3_9BACT|nr:AmmeMemoRadiSam system protein A [Maridesulfovibrio hydrothermalis]CCO22763.1 Protein TON_1965 [Maridesulfovibrio hydrothermalis AM13 = DSM 14728]
MSDNFSFSLNDEEKKYLKDLVKFSILSKLKGDVKAVEIPEPPTTHLAENLGAFVTLNKNGQLRGCIGNVQGTGPLYQTIWQMARAAAFEDPRFPALAFHEYEEIEIEISILSPISLCPDTDQIIIGRHGLIMQRGGHSGLLLPQVAVDWKWDRQQFLAQTCQKAGMEPDAWQDEATNIFWFEAEVF